MIKRALSHPQCSNGTNACVHGRWWVSGVDPKSRRDTAMGACAHFYFKITGSFDSCCNPQTAGLSYLRSTPSGGAMAR